MNSSVFRRFSYNIFCDLKKVLKRQHGHTVRKCKNITGQIGLQIFDCGAKNVVEHYGKRIEILLRIWVIG